MKLHGLKWSLAIAVALIVSGCPQSAANTCTALTCANGCCSAAGVCTTANTNAACGLSGATCAVCSAQNSCNASGLCSTGAPPRDGGATVTDGGSAVVDAGNPCIDAPGDAVLGTFTAMNGATVMSSGALPAGVIAVTEVNGALYGLTATRTVNRIGPFPSLVLGPAIAQIVPDSVDAGDDSLFISAYLATAGTRVLAGYTQPGAGFPGQVAVVDVNDAGVQFFNAPGNFAAVGIGDAFVINGGGLGTLAGNAVYALRPSATTTSSRLTSFDAAFNVNASGTAAATPGGILLLGYSQAPDYENVVRAIRSETYAAALAAGTSFTFAPSTSSVVHGFDVAEVTTLGESAVVVRGNYGANGPYTTSLETVALTQPSGTDVVQVGATRVLLTENGSQCTRILFTGTSASTLYIALQDARGQRLVKFKP